MRVSPPGHELTLGGHTLDIGRVHLFHTRVLAQNSRQVLRALDAGSSAGTTVALRPVNGETFRMYLDRAVDDDQPLIPVPLGLPGFPDPA